MDIAPQVVLAVLALAGATLGEVSLSVTDCARHKNTELLTFRRVQTSPYPIGIPGDLAVTGSLKLNRDATGDVSLDVTIERYVGFFWLTIPCIGSVGSCTYKDTCGLLSDGFGNGTDGCPSQLIENNLPCMCPIPAGTYTMHNTVFTISELSGLWSWLAEGDYRVTAKLIDNPTGEEIACQHLEATIVDGHPSCSGFLCSVFG